MIKTALKHFLYEICINVLFSRLGRNFNVFKTRYKFKKGDKFRYIKIFLRTRGDFSIYYNCEVWGVWEKSIWITHSNCIEYIGSKKNVKTPTNGDEFSSTVYFSEIKELPPKI